MKKMLFLAIVGAGMVLAGSADSAEARHVGHGGFHHGGGGFHCPPPPPRCWTPPPPKCWKRSVFHGGGFRQGGFRQGGFRQGGFGPRVRFRR